VDEALARAARHARSSLAEALAALHALLDAGSLLAAGSTAGEAGLAPVVHALEQARGWLDGEAAADATLLAALFEALDAEVERWEERGREDPDARAVLRAFLAVREVLWEIRQRANASSPPRPTDPAARGPRLQRVEVEG
jgi:hypothetical protein